MVINQSVIYSGQLAVIYRHTDIFKFKSNEICHSQLDWESSTSFWILKQVQNDTM